MNNLSSLNMLAELTDSLWFPIPNSSLAANVDGLFYFILWISTIFFVLIIGLMIYFMIKYRRQDGVEPEPSPSHNTVLELTWTIIPSILVVIIFSVGFAGYNDMRTPPLDCEEVYVNARQWGWDFRYPNGIVNNELHVTVNKPCKLIMSSSDVLHSLFIPVCRAKQDVVPGRYSYLWFDTFEPGRFELFCTEYCGKEHSKMITKMVSHPLAKDKKNAEDQTFEEWMNIASKPDLDPSNYGPDGKYDPVIYGSKLYVKKGCNSCHALDNKKNTGPSFSKNWGKEREFTDGTKTVMNEDYIKESLFYPGAKIRKEYENKMPSFMGQLKDKDVEAIIAFIKSYENK